MHAHISVRGFSIHTSSPTFAICRPLDYSRFHRCEMISQVLIFISQMISDIEHPFLCLFAVICVYFLEKYVKRFCPFFYFIAFLY